MDITTDLLYTFLMGFSNGGNLLFNDNAGFMNSFLVFA
jgi:hypothetical protein